MTHHDCFDPFKHFFEVIWSGILGVAVWVELEQHQECLIKQSWNALFCQNFLKRIGIKVTFTIPRPSTSEGVWPSSLRFRTWTMWASLDCFGGGGCSLFASSHWTFCHLFPSPLKPTVSPPQANLPWNILEGDQKCCNEELDAILFSLQWENLTATWRRNR